MTPGELLDLQRRQYEYLANVPEHTREFYDDLYDVLAEAARSPQYAGFPSGSNFARSTWIAWFYPCNRGRDLLPLLRKSLYQAPVYDVTEKIVDAVTDMYRKTSEVQAVSFTAADLPSPTGFIWLAKPVVLSDVGGTPLSTRAVSWSPVTIRSAQSRLAGDGIRWTAWSQPGDEHEQAVRSLPGAPLALSSSQVTPFGHELKRMDMQLIGGKLVPAPAGHHPDDLLFWLQTLWMFMGTEIVATERAEVSRPFRRRAERVIGHSAVNVVQLRRISYKGREIGHRDVNWTCSWIVQGHWRHIEDYAGLAESHRAKPDLAYRVQGHILCAVCAARITRIRPHVNDPAGMPLKVVPETVYRVAR